MGIRRRMDYLPLAYSMFEFDLRVYLFHEDGVPYQGCIAEGPRCSRGRIILNAQLFRPACQTAFLWYSPLHFIP